MITAIYSRDNHRLTIDGHADYAVQGQDIVCAAASMLCYTLAANVGSMEDRDIVCDTAVELDDENGSAVISCGHNDGCGEIVTAAFDAVCTGLKLLSEEYPENITYRQT